MVTRHLSRLVPLILPARLVPALLLPALSACGGEKPVPPLSPAALAAVVARPDAPRAALARAIDTLFTDPTLGETRALVLMHNGRIVAERYAPGYGPNTKLLGWSLANSVTGVLVGLLVSDGRLRLDESAPVPNWQRAGDPRGEITLRQLLQMRSGLAHIESSQPAGVSDTTRMLFLDGRDDMAAYAEAQPLSALPGSQWRYSTATGVILADIAARALTDSADPHIRQQVLGDYLHTRLFVPLGMTSAVAEYDAAGTLIGGGMIHATARDWARFGEFLRNHGVVKGAQIVPSDWVRLMTSPSPANPGYGAQVWLNRPQANGQGGSEQLFPDRAPASLFAAIGRMGQYVVVSPDQHLTLVRLGKTTSGQRANLRARLGDIVDLYARR